MKENYYGGGGWNGGWGGGGRVKYILHLNLL